MYKYYVHEIISKEEKDKQHNKNSKINKKCITFIKPIKITF